MTIKCATTQCHLFYKIHRITSDVSRLPILFSVSMELWREEIAVLQLVANGSIFCNKTKQTSIYILGQRHSADQQWRCCNCAPVWSECSGCGHMGRCHQSLWWAETSQCASVELSETSGLHTEQEQSSSHRHDFTQAEIKQTQRRQSFTHWNCDVSLHFYCCIFVHEKQNWIKCVGHRSLVERRNQRAWLNQKKKKTII